MRFFREELQGLKNSIAQELSEFCDGNPSMIGSENWRMVDYFPIRHEEETAVGPRCGKHRDYGSFTIIVADQPGFEVYNTATGKSRGYCNLALKFSAIFCVFVLVQFVPFGFFYSPLGKCHRRSQIFPVSIADFDSSKVLVHYLVKISLLTLRGLIERLSAPSQSQKGHFPSKTKLKK